MREDLPMLLLTTPTRSVTKIDSSESDADSHADSPLSAYPGVVLV